MYSKEMSNVQKQYAQYHSALHCDGVVPIFDKKVKAHKDGFWIEFSIKPTEMSRIYRVLIIYVNGRQPYSYVIAPDIVKISDDRTVPHLYSQANQQLCLTYPSFYEWDTNKLIIDTHIPWIELWLFYYEDWLLSDKWSGGGKHPEVEPEFSKSEDSSTKNTNSKKKTSKRKSNSALSIANKIYNARKLKYDESKKEDLLLESKDG